jgi:hypothetical protein
VRVCKQSSDKIATFATFLYPEQGQKAMNRDAEAIKNMLVWLSQEPGSTVLAPSGKSDRRVGRTTEWTGWDAADLQPYLDPLDSEDIAVRLTYLTESTYFPVAEFSFFEPGETPAVQDRFHSLLKRRLRNEIELNPPVFPWETEGYEYDAELEAEPVSAGRWRLSLNLPVPMPERVLSQLFRQCQVVMKQSLQEGKQLVQAVTTLFPGQDAALNQLAGMVLASPNRSGAIAPLKGAGFPADYDSATPPQQMALSLLAAKEIIESLTLNVTAGQPVERQWQMVGGMLSLVAEYDATTRKVRVQGHLPGAGKVDFTGTTTQATAQRSEAGEFSLELFDLQPNQSYLLDVQLAGTEESSVIFAILPRF